MIHKDTRFFLKFVSESMESIRIGIAGTGKIIPESVKALQETGYEVVSIWGRHPEKAQPPAERFRIPRVCASYVELLASGIDFVYIGLVNTVHFDFARQALEAGLNVILEKPFCSSAMQARTLAEMARSKGLYLFENISSLYLPAWQALRDQLPDIGTVRLFQADFSQYSSRYDDYLQGRIAPAFDPACEGGALRDLNVYNLHLAVSLFGTPGEALYRANRGPNGIDTSGVALLVYPGCLAVCSAAKDSGKPSGVTIQGEKGCLHMEGTPNGGSDRLRHPFAAFRDMYLQNNRSAMLAALDHTLAVMEVLDRLTAADQ